MRIQDSGYRIRDKEPDMPESMSGWVWNQIIERTRSEYPTGSSSG